MTVKTGVEVLLESPRRFISGSVGLVTNPTGVTRSLESTLDALHRHAEVKLEALFGPEHGARGDVQDALPVTDAKDAATGLPVYSLYGDCEKPSEEMLDGLDVLLFDIQDCGARFYTYVSTLTHCMEAAAAHGVTVTVLDRPNPINGDTVEGPVLEPGYESFIGLHPVPVRHGLTVGELALFINRGIGCDLTVVEMQGWTRGMWFDETGLPWVQPSPNLPTLDTATVFPGTCFFEGVNASEGRGTTRPFELLGAPWVNPRLWADRLNGLELPGVRFRQCFFTPTFWRFKDEQCSGVQPHVTSRDTHKPVETGVHLLSSLIMLHPDTFTFNPPSYDPRMHFDLLAGSDRLRAALTERLPVEEIVSGWTREVEAYKRKAEQFKLYGEEP